MRDQFLLRAGQLAAGARRGLMFVLVSLAGCVDRTDFWPESPDAAQDSAVPVPTAPPAPADPPKPEVSREATEGSPKPLAEILDGIEKVLGGRDAFSALPAVKFKLQVLAGGKVSTTRDVLFDKPVRRLRSDSRGRQGEVLLFLCDLATDRSVLRLDDVLQEGEAADGSKQKLRRTAALDLNYLLLPWRLRDTDVSVIDQGRVEFEEKSLHSLKVTYTKDGGDLFGDEFELLIDPTSFLPLAMRVRFKSMRTDQQPLTFVLEDWVELKGVKLALRRRGAAQTIEFDALEAVPALDPKAFEGL